MNSAHELLLGGAVEHMMFCDDASHLGSGSPFLVVVSSPSSLLFLSFSFLQWVIFPSQSFICAPFLREPPLIAIRTEVRGELRKEEKLKS